MYANLTENPQSIIIYKILHFGVLGLFGIGRVELMADRVVQKFDILTKDQRQKVLQKVEERGQLPLEKSKRCNKRPIMTATFPN